MDRENSSELPLSSYMKCCLTTVDDISKVSNTLLTLSTGAIALIVSIAVTPHANVRGIPGVALSLLYSIPFGLFLRCLSLWIEVSNDVMGIRTLAVARNESAIIGSYPLEKEMKSVLRDFSQLQKVFVWAVGIGSVFVGVLRSISTK
jgi:hypothetical protein